VACGSASGRVAIVGNGRRVAKEKEQKRKGKRRKESAVANHNNISHEASASCSAPPV